MLEVIQYSDLTEKILGACFEVQNELGVGFLESVYRNALMLVLQENGMNVRQEVALDVCFRGKKIGRFIADILVEDKVVVELKSCKTLLAEHQAQTINYLKAINFSVGLLVNFGQARLEYKRVHNPHFKLYTS